MKSDEGGNERVAGSEPAIQSASFVHTVCLAPSLPTLRVNSHIVFVDEEKEERELLTQIADKVDAGKQLLELVKEHRPDTSGKHTSTNKNGITYEGAALRAALDKFEWEKVTLGLEDVRREVERILEDVLVRERANDNESVVHSAGLLRRDLGGLVYKVLTRRVKEEKEEKVEDEEKERVREGGGETKGEGKFVASTDKVYAGVSDATNFLVHVRAAFSKEGGGLPVELLELLGAIRSLRVGEIGAIEFLRKGEEILGDEAELMKELEAFLPPFYRMVGEADVEIFGGATEKLWGKGVGGGEKRGEGERGGSPGSGAVDVDFEGLSKDERLALALNQLTGRLALAKRIAEKKQRGAMIRKAVEGGDEGATVNVSAV